MNKSLMSEDDKNEIKNLKNNIFIPAQREITFITDMENIRKMAKMSEIMHQSYNQDILYSGGDMDALGTTIHKKIKNGEFTQEDELLVKAWQVINDKIPSPLIKELESLSVKK